jgi:hypothetical protein
MNRRFTSSPQSSASLSFPLAFRQIASNCYPTHQRCPEIDISTAYLNAPRPNVARDLLGLGPLKRRSNRA